MQQFVHALAQLKDSRICEAHAHDALALHERRVESREHIRLRGIHALLLHLVQQRRGESDLQPRFHRVAELRAAAGELRSPHPLRVARLANLDREIHRDRSLRRQAHRALALSRSRGRIELDSHLHLARLLGRVVDHSTQHHRVADICKARHRGFEHHRLVDLESALRISELIALRLHDGHDAVAREPVGHDETRMHLALRIAAQRRGPICGAEKIPPHTAVAALPESADEVALVFKQPLRNRIRSFAQQLLDREPRRHVEPQQLAEKCERVRCVEARETQHALVRGPQRDVGIRDRLAVHVAHLGRDLRLLAGLIRRARRLHVHVKFCIRPRDAHLRVADAILGHLEFLRAVLRAAQHDHGDEHIRRIALLDRHADRGRIAFELREKVALHVLALDRHERRAVDWRLHQNDRLLSAAILGLVRDEFDLEAVAVIPRELLLAIHAHGRRGDHIVPRGVARDGGDKIQARLIERERRVLFLRLGEQPLAAILHELRRLHLRLPDELHDRLAAEIFRFIRVLHAVRLPLDARELHRRLDDVGRRRAVRAHGDDLQRQRLAFTHDFGHVPDAEVKVRAVREELRALRDGLLVDVRDFREEAHAARLRHA